jgi:ATP-dependent DNA helicase RecQ
MYSTTRSAGPARRPDDPAIADAVAEILGDGAILRPGQLEAISAALDHDTLAVLATGTGKSLVYRVVGRLIGGTTVVISPTLALQADQLAALHEAGPRAAVLNSTLSAGRRRRILGEVAEGRVRFLLLAPEQLSNGEVMAALSATSVELVVIDEAHCVSSWGHDFRPDYLALSALIAGLGEPRLLALTATASARVRDEIVGALRMREPAVVVGEVDRPEIWFGTRVVADARAADETVIDLVRRQRAEGAGGAAIVYLATRSHVESLTELLAAEGFEPHAYHGALPRKQRDAVHAAFRSGGAELVVATNAFGLGVDRPDVRLVVHGDPPENLDAYYQEAGRAGRDGEPAEAILVSRPDGYGIRRYFAAGAPPGRAALLALLAALEKTPGSRRMTELAGETSLSARQLRRVANALLAVGAIAEDRRGVRRARSDEPEQLARQAIELAEQHQAMAASAVELVRRYAETQSCRRRLVLELLGEPARMPCRNCDNCDAGHGGEVVDVPFALGSPVQHPTFGRGVVEQYEQDRITVLFAEHGFKTLALDAVQDKELLAAAD